MILTSLERSSQFMKGFVETGRGFAKNEKVISGAAPRPCSLLGSRIAHGGSPATNAPRRETLGISATAAAAARASSSSRPSRCLPVHISLHERHGIVSPFITWCSLPDAHRTAHPHRARRHSGRWQIGPGSAWVRAPGELIPLGSQAIQGGQVTTPSRPRRPAAQRQAARRAARRAARQAA